MTRFIDRHPKERPSAALQVNRRSFLGGSLAAAVGVTAGSSPASGLRKRQWRWGRRGADVRNPARSPRRPGDLADLYDDNQPIADGLRSRRTVGVLKVLNYADYMAPGVMKDFEKKYGAKVEVTPYNNYDEMLTKISAPGAEFDVVFPGPSVMSRMVYGQAAPAVPAVVPDQPEERLARVPETRGTTKARSTASPTPCTPPESATAQTA